MREAGPAEQDRVGEEPDQLPQVGRPAMGEVFVRLRRYPGRSSGQRHQRGVRGLLAADDHHRPVLAAQRRQPAAPSILAAEQPHDHDVGAVQQRGQPGQR